jgi:hypothetical protein
LERHEQTLKELGMKLRDSEASLRRLTPLYELSLRQNESLKTCNGQMAERMRERDEDLARACDQIDILEKRFLKAAAAIIILGAIIAVAAAIKVIQFFRL